MCALLLGCALFAGCPPPAPPVRPNDDRERSDALAGDLAEARAGVKDERLAALLVDHWRWVLEDDPLYATEVGVHALDDRLPDRSPRGYELSRARRRDLLKRARAIDAAPLTPSDALSLEVLRFELESAVRSEGCRFEEWTVNPRDNPITRWNNLPEVHQVKSARDAENLVARYRGIARSIDDEVRMLARGARDGLYAPRESIERVITMHRELAAQPPERWAMASPLAKPIAGSRRDSGDAESGVDEALRRRLRAELLALVKGDIRAALGRYAAYLDGLKGRGREGAESGLVGLPRGPECYRARIHAFTTIALDPESVHTLGRAEIERTDAAITELGKRVFGTDSLAATLGRLRDDRAIYFTSAEQIESEAETALRAAEAAVPRVFGTLPKTPCVVRRIPDYEARFTTIAYYRPPHPGGAKPGEYFVNVLDPATRPRFEARALAFHEAVPGHHTQIAVAQELGSVPAFRRHGTITAYVEGWALYAERLADELGLYRDDLDRLGMLSFEAWRAARLVVDSGVHARGWTREQATAYMAAHTALSLGNIDNEVDRYVIWPGQALAYKIGQLEILRLRELATNKLGAAFSLPKFHDVLLLSGPVPLTVLAQRVDAFVKRENPAATR
jgi:uncharacterized protein (DUF885 family)